MTADLLGSARDYLVLSSQGKLNHHETVHPWRKDWEFAVLHSLRVEQYVLKILARERHRLTETEIRLLRLAAILHDIARLDQRENHANVGATIARDWLQAQADGALVAEEIDRVVGMVATHSDKDEGETDYCRAVLKDADTLDEIGVMSVFMASNWLDARSPLFFNGLLHRLVEYEIPFCDKKMAILNTEGARAILREKREFIQRVIEQLTDEIELDGRIERQLLQSQA
ncbi:MAG TPA: HD domain-containing protein [Anaerolineales bacterium]|nr:HD domain-containing protein [Anaerolineales bacterium]